MTSLERGITLNPGIIRGGTRTNVSPSEAEAEFDLRVASKLDGDLMMRKVHALRAVNKKCKLQIEGGINRPPLERSPAVVALFQQAQKIAKELGSQSARSPWAEARTATSPRVWVFPRWMAWALSVMARILPASRWWRLRCRAAPRCWQD